MISTHTAPSLQGTLAKRTEPTLQTNFTKEPFRPSRSNAGLRDSANLIDKQIENINRHCLTMYYSALKRAIYGTLVAILNYDRSNSCHNKK